jgi:hypothetical protein
VLEVWLRHFVLRLAEQMSSLVCSHCKYIHSAAQICPKQYFQIPIGLKDSGRNFGCIVIRYDTTDDELLCSITRRYGKELSGWTILTRIYRVSSKLYVVSPPRNWLNWKIGSY